MCQRFALFFLWYDLENYLSNFGVVNTLLNCPLDIKWFSWKAITIAEQITIVNHLKRKVISF